MQKLDQKIVLIISVLILGVAIIFAGGAVKDGLKEFRSFDRSVTMKGLAERDVVADLSIWTLSYTETGNDLSRLQDIIDEKGKKILSFLSKNNIAADAVELQDVRVQDLMAQSYRQNNAVVNRYILTQTYLVRTTDTGAVHQASKKLGDLIRQGVVFSQNGSTAPSYLYTKLNDVKPEMIAEATKNARAAAKEFAKNSGQKVGGIKYASQGVFQIRPRDQSYTVPESQQKDKTVRIVSTIQFYLED